MNFALKFFILAYVVLGLSGCGQKLEESVPNKTSQARPIHTNSIITAPVDYIATTIQTGEQAKGKLELIAIQKAIEFFQQEEGRNPSSLEEMLEKSYLRSIPKPPVKQMFSYDAEKGTVKLVPEK